MSREKLSEILMLQEQVRCLTPLVGRKRVKSICKSVAVLGKKKNKRGEFNLFVWNNPQAAAQERKERFLKWAVKRINRTLGL